MSSSFENFLLCTESSTGIYLDFLTEAIEAVRSCMNVNLDFLSEALEAVRSCVIVRQTLHTQKLLRSNWLSLSNIWIIICIFVQLRDSTEYLLLPAAHTSAEGCRDARMPKCNWIYTFLKICYLVFYWYVTIWYLPCFNIPELRNFWLIVIQLELFFSSKRQIY